MAVSSRWLTGYKLHPVACDHALALTVLAINLVQPGANHGDRQIDLTVTGVILIVIASGSLVFRRMGAAHRARDHPRRRDLLRDHRRA